MTSEKMQELQAARIAKAIKAGCAGPPLPPETIDALRVLLRPAIQTVEVERSAVAPTSRSRKIRFVRGPRSIPTLSRIADFHGIGSLQPFCTHCGDQVPAKSWDEAGPYIDRCHMIDRVLAGLDGAQNLAPQCPNCHRQQPSFGPGDEAKALEWFAHLPKSKYITT